ncbi:MAG: response regulator [Bacteroidia bacterium]
MNNIRLCIVDDHPVVREGIRLMLEKEPAIDAVEDFGDGNSLFTFLENNVVDIILLDIEMPVMSGLEACHKLVQEYPDIGVIVLSMQREISLIKAMFQAGAKGYLLKNADRHEILYAIREVHAGRQFVGSEVAQLLIGTINGEATHGNSPSIPSLSRREKEVLALIVKEYTTREIAEELSLGPDTIETHRRRLLDKLQVRNTAGLVRMCFEYNLLGK